MNETVSYVQFAYALNGPATMDSLYQRIGREAHEEIECLIDNLSEALFTADEACADNVVCLEHKAIVKGLASLALLQTLFERAQLRPMKIFMDIEQMLIERQRVVGQVVASVP